MCSTENITLLLTISCSYLQALIRLIILQIGDIMIWWCYMVMKWQWDIDDEILQMEEWKCAILGDFGFRRLILMSFDTIHVILMVLHLFLMLNEFIYLSHLWTWIWIDKSDLYMCYLLNQSLSWIQIYFLLQLATYNCTHSGILQV
jgi:hypothetical protein